MSQLTIFNPDDFLGAPRIWSPDAGKIAWEKTYESLEFALKNSKQLTYLYVVCGIQGAGKSTWIQKNREFFKPGALILDAALPGARHRHRAVFLTQQYGALANAIWINTPLEQALVRNRLRPADEQVPDETIKTVAEIFEVPTEAEGFFQVIEIES